MMRRDSGFGGRALCVSAAVAGLIVVSCQGVENVEGAREPLTPEASAGAGGQGTAPDVGQQPAPEASTGEKPPTLGLAPDGDVNNQSGDTQCEPDAGSCASIGDAGSPPSGCVPTGPRDCSSELDNDCDGLPDNTPDAVCVCVLGTVESCEEHPGFDGLGLCKPGTRTCEPAGDGGVATDWSECAGSVGPGAADSCTVAGDDTDCDGAPNSGCTCVDGDTQQCGSTTDLGVCAFGTSTCANGAFGQCAGAVPPAARDTCAEGNDANCNGVPNEGCLCLDGDTRQCGSTDTGPCSFGTQSCANGTFGGCQGAVSPAASDSCAEGNDSNCNGIPNEGCGCINGDTRTCGTTEVGVCALGTQTCVNGTFGQQCNGAVNPGPRNCGSAQDNDCDGAPDNTLDNVCECTPGQNGPCSGDPNNSRCNGQGQCAPCQSAADCALVGGGRDACEDGECVAVAPPPPPPPPPAAPLDCDSPDAQQPQAPLPPFTESDAAAPEPTGGTIEDGVYVTSQVQIFRVDNVAAVAGETIEFRNGTFSRNLTNYTTTTGDALSGSFTAGTFVTIGSALAVESIACNFGDIRTSDVWDYSVSGSRLELHRPDGQSGVRISVLTRQ